MHVAEILPGIQIEPISLVVSSDDKENYNGQGMVYVTDPDYTTCHDHAGEARINYNEYHTVGQRYNIYGLEEYQVFRCVMRFDLTGLPVGASITSAALTLLAALQVFHYTEWDIVLVDGSDCTDPLVKEDYGDLLDDVTSLGSIAVSTIMESTTFTITLNAAGRAFLESKAGSVAVLAVRSSDDISGDAPTGDFEAYEGTECQFAIISTTDYPYITITYTE